MMDRLTLFLIRTYQIMASCVKSLLGEPMSCCRFYPTCSEYALQAVRSHGTLRGGWLALRRVAQCHPWSRAGFDPVPVVAKKRNLPS